jgi:transcriptional regulator with XRE-family HTH domain
MAYHFHGERMKAIRKEKGITQLQLRAITGIGQPDLSDYENNKKPPEMPRVAAIAEALETNIDYLCGLSDYPHPLTEDDIMLLNVVRSRDVHAFEGLYVQLTRKWLTE